MNKQYHNALLFKKYITSNDLNSFQQQHYPFDQDTNHPYSKDRRKKKEKKKRERGKSPTCEEIK